MINLWLQDNLDGPLVEHNQTIRASFGFLAVVGGVLEGPKQATDKMWDIGNRQCQCMSAFVLPAQNTEWSSLFRFSYFFEGEGVSSI